MDNEHLHKTEKQPQVTLPAETKAEQETRQTIAAPALRDVEAIRAAEADIPGEWNIGDVILDLYEVKHVHKGGGMGLVYKVYHRGWNIALAVKSPRQDYFQTEKQKANFIHECDTWINLGLHPNIVSCYYVRTLGGTPRVFAEYVEGGSLKDWIDNRNLYEGGSENALKRILDVAIQFTWGLHYAHEQKQKLVHQDVKPANVMMTADGTTKLTDFGLARARAAAGEHADVLPSRSVLVSAGGMTLAYCSPEQVYKQKLSHKTDIWSWGVSVLEMFVGEVRWESGVVASFVLDQYLEQGVPAEGIPFMPALLADLLKQCFQDNPDARPKDMQEIVARLKEIYRQVTGKEYPRPEPKAAELLADGLNNKAISLLDLGKDDESEKLFDDALKSDAHHAEAIYNRGLLLWRSGRLTDNALIKQLEDVRTSHEGGWRDEYYLGLVHIERGDAESAVKILEEACSQAPDSVEIQRALTTARSGQGKWRSCIMDFEGRTDSTSSVSISPDGRWALSGSDDKTLKLWKLATGRCVRTFEGHTWSVNSVSISPDGRWGLSGSGDETLKLWELATGRCRRTFEGHTDWVRSVCISPDGRWGLSGSGSIGENKDKTLKLWELATGKCTRTFEGHTKMVSSVSISPDGRWGLSGSSDKTLKLWELATGRCLRTFEGHTDDVNSVSISPDGCWGLSGSRDETLKLWELATGKCIRTFEGHTSYVNSVSISPDGRRGLSGSGDNTLKLWELRETGPSGSFAVAFPRSAAEVGELAVTVQEAAERARAALEQGLASDAAEEVTRARQVPGYEKNPALLKLWQEMGMSGRCSGFSEGWFLRTFEGHTGWVSSVSISPDGRWGLSGSWDNTLKLWELSTGKCLRTFEGHTGWVRSVCISPDGRWGLSGGDNAVLKLWELASGKCIRTFKGHTSSVTSISISPDGRRGLSGSWGHTLKLWELATGKCIRTFKGHTSSVHSVSISPDGRWALSGSADKTLKLWKLNTRKCVRTFEGHTDGVGSVSISPDGRWGLSGSNDDTLKLWELTTGKYIRTFRGHRGDVSSISISPNGRWALSGSVDNTLKLWELATGRCVRTFEGHMDYVNFVSISPDGRWGLSGSSDNKLKLWELVWDYEFPEPVDWDEGARPYLEIFLTLHIPYGSDGISRRGTAKWTEEDFQKLLQDFGYRGYGWLRPDGVRQKLEEMAREWEKKSWFSRLFGK